MDNSNKERYSLHISDMKTFIQCRIKHYFTSYHHMGKGLTDLDATSPIARGTAVHKLLEQYYNEQEVEQSAHSELVADYIAHQQDKDKFRILATEKLLSVELPNGFLFNARIDLITEDEKGIQFYDFKVTGQNFTTYAKYLANTDLQPRAYAYMGKRLFGDRFNGITFRLIRNKPLGKPKINANGLPSRDKNQYVSWQSYEAILNEKNLPVDDYNDMREAFIGNIPVFDVPMSFTNQQLKNFERLAMELSKEMFGESVSLYPASSVLTCRECPFEFPCSLVLDGNQEGYVYALNHYKDSSYAENIKLEETK